MIKKLFCSTALATALTCTAGHAIAQAPAEENRLQIDEITITARKKEEGIQSAPLAVSALSGADLERAGIDSFDQILSTIPNAGQSGGIAGGLQGLISIRGISTLVRFAGLETGVGFYLDGVYIGRPENFNQDLIDIDRVEVLRGPQGAVFGKNTIAGAINIITKTPSDEFEATIEGQYGNYNHVNIKGYIAGPLVEDTLSASLSAGYRRQDGFVENISGIGPDLDSVDLATFRGKLRFTPNENTEFILAADAMIDRSDPSFFEVSDVSFVDDPSEATPFTVNQDQPNFLDRDIYGLSLASNVQVGDGTWTTILGYRDTSFDGVLDDDKVPVRFFVDFFSSDTDFFSVESRYSGSLGDQVEYVAGIYYFTQNANNLSNFALGDFLTGVPGVEPTIDLISSVDTDSFAVFFNVDWSITEQLTLELGGRFVTEKRTGVHIQDDTTGLFGSTDFSIPRRDEDFAPTVSLSYAFDENISTYARFAQGFKSSAFNTDFIGAGANLTADPELATAYEIGLKSDLLDNRLRLNLAVFYTDYENLQLAQIAGLGVSLNNAAEAEIYGVEAEFIGLVNEYLTINGSLGYLDATYKDFPGCPVPGAETGPVSMNCGGNFLNLAPEWTTALAADVRYPIMNNMDLVVRADWNYRSEVFFEPQNSLRLSGEGRHLVNLRVGVAQDQWEITAWAKNLFDETYVNYADDRSAIFVNTTQAFGAPQTYGVTVRFKFP